MKRLFVTHLAVLLAIAMHTGLAQGTTQAEKLLAGAQHKATIEGDLKGAIEEYRKAVAAAGADRALAAQALLRMAECHQKLGESDARAIYERLVRDYGDQKDVAVLARTRLGGAAAASAVKGDRSVWTGRDADGFGTISPDGRYLTFADWPNGADLALRDLTKGTNHRLTSGGSTQFSAISKDGRFVAYQWRDAKTPSHIRGYTLRVARLDGTAISDSRQVLNNDEVADIAPFDWSPDGNWIAALITRHDSTNQIALASVRDGALRVLQSLDWKEPTKIFFSPDGRFIAYDLPASDTGNETHVFVMAIDGSGSTAVAAHPSQNTIMGWSPDGRQVLFSSDRSGSFGLWSTPVDHGKPAGPPTLIKADIASSWSLGLTSAGTMYVWRYASPVYLQASAIDLNAGKLTPGSSTFQRFIGSRGRPDWSSDGRQLAYQTCDPLGAGPCSLWIRSMESGELRELKVKLGYFFFARWSPDGRELLTRARDLRGRNDGFYRIDAHTGDVKRVPGAPGPGMPLWAPDGKHLFYRRDAFLIERDFESGAERQVAQLPPNASRDIAISPDGRQIAYVLPDGAGSNSLVVMPLTGGAARSVLRAAAPERVMFRFDWTADGQALAAIKERSDTGRRELWLAPVSGGSARKLDVDISQWLIEDGFRVDRAGKQIAFVAAAGQPGLEIRALENFLPPPPARTSQK